MLHVCICALVAIYLPLQSLADLIIRFIASYIADISARVNTLTTILLCISNHSRHVLFYYLIWHVKISGNREYNQALPGFMSARCTDRRAIV